jgi:hypothetical protein
MLVRAEHARVNSDGFTQQPGFSLCSWESEKKKERSAAGDEREQRLLARSPAAQGHHVDGAIWPAVLKGKRGAFTFVSTSLLLEPACTRFLVQKER